MATLPTLHRLDPGEHITRTIHIRIPLATTQFNTPLLQLRTPQHRPIAGARMDMDMDTPTKSE